MSIPKEKLIIQEIKEIVNRECEDIKDLIRMQEKIQELVNAYRDPGYIGGPVVGEPEERKIPCPGRYNCSPCRYTDKFCCTHCQHSGIATPVPMDAVVLIGVVGSIGDWPGMTFVCNSCNGMHTGIQRHLIKGNSVCPACASKVVVGEEVKEEEG